MSKYHLNTETGAVSLCRALQRDCPLGGNNIHADDPTILRKKFEDENDAFPAPLKKIKLESNLGSAQVTDGDLTDSNARLLLTSGLCGDLAHEIVKETGWPPVLVLYSDSTEEELEKRFKENPNVVFEAQHIMVETPDGKFLDAYGAKDFEDVDDFYEGITIVKGTPEMVEHFSDKNSSRLQNFAKSALKLYENNITYDYDSLDEYD